MSDQPHEPERGHDAPETEDHNREIDQLIAQALDAHGAAITPAAPAFADVLQHRQQRHRRHAVAASVAVLGVGLAGLAIAGSRNDDGELARSGPAATDASANSSTGASVGTTTDMSAPAATADDDTVPTSTGSALPPSRPTTSVAPDWFCTGYLGVDAQQRELYSECVPVKELISSDWACTGRLGTDDVGRVRFTECEALGALGQLPPEPDERPIDVRVPRTYTVAAGDFPIRVATAFCTTVAELERINGWSDSAIEFARPEQVILVPERVDGETCGSPYTIEVGDFPLDLADRFCVSVEALNVANADDPAYSPFLPGTEITIPPSLSGTCPQPD